MIRGLIAILALMAVATVAQAQTEAAVDSTTGFERPNLASPAEVGLGPAPDRLQHFSLSFASGLGIGLATREPLAAAGGAMVLGIGKELWDARHGHFDGRDLLADAIGAALACLAVASLER